MGLGRGGNGDGVCAREKGRGGGGREGEDVKLFRELPRRERWLLEAFIDP